MARGLVVFVLGLTVGLVAGAGGMLIAFPFVFPPPIVAEAPPNTATGQASGDGVYRFVGDFRFDDMAPGRDGVHWANGTGGVYRGEGMSVLRLDDNFETGPGPAYWLYLNTTAVGEEDDFEADSGRLKVAPLKSFSGGQNYMLPADVRIENFHTVTIWCEAFDAYIGSAPLPKG